MKVRILAGNGLRTTPGKCPGCKADYDPEVARKGTYKAQGRAFAGDPHRKCKHAPCAFACPACYPELVRA